MEPQLPVHWEWTTDWEIDTTSTQCDADGWIYAFDFTMYVLTVHLVSNMNMIKGTLE